MTVHVPILLPPIRDALLEPFRLLPQGAPPHGLVDCTLGGGGHTSAFLEAFAQDSRFNRHKVIAFDQDPSAIEAGRKRFEPELRDARLEIHHLRFSEVGRFLEGKARSLPILGFLADLGFSSDQLEDATRGLSFQAEGPLDMRLDRTRGQSVYEYLSHVTQTELEAVIRNQGEERFSGRIARVIVESRQSGELPQTSLGLAELIRRAVPPQARFGRIHPATRAFQALRIQVNGELEELDALLGDVILCLKPGGRVAVISFHSLEDRRVKWAFKSGPWHPLFKKPLEAGEDEVRANPRSRSAKLRIAEKKTSKGTDRCRGGSANGLETGGKNESP